MHLALWLQQIILQMLEIAKYLFLVLISHLKNADSNDVLNKYQKSFL